MKKCLFALAALSMLFACAPENNIDGGTQNNPEELTITGEALDVTYSSVTLTGYANLPDELVDAEVGIMYDKQQSFEGAKKVAATRIDDDNKFTVIATGLESSTTYYYKSYVQNGMTLKYGAVKSFTTSSSPVESVSLDKTEYTFIEIGSTLTLTATVLNADTPGEDVEWASDNEDVATVDADGLVTAKGNGTANITVTTKGQGKSATCVITVAQWVTSLSFYRTSLTMVIGAKDTLNVTRVLPENANDKTFTWSSSDGSVATVDDTGWITAIAKGNATIKATANDGSGVFASCSVDVCRIDIPEAVDMGTIVNGKNIKWASFNVGASSPEEYGLYYAWGETEPKTNYSWSNYQWGTSTSSLTKYNTKDSKGIVDNNMVLDPEDDVAQVKLGGGWRMPTDEEWMELMEKCTWSWTTNYKGSGVKGITVTATNGKSIFLPEAGRRSDFFPYDVDSFGYYWSSSLYESIPHFASGVEVVPGSLIVSKQSYNRCFGLSVRAVIPDIALH